MAINLALTLTLDGRDAFWNSGNTGVKLDITHLQFGTRNRLPTGEESSLSLPKQTVKIQNGNKIGPDQVRIMATMPGTENYNVTEIGLWSGEPGSAGSILIAYTSVRTGFIAQMVAGIDLVFTYDMVISTADIDKVNIVTDTDQSSTFALLAKHEADRNAHPFYVTTDTAQTISGAKTFTNKAIFSGGLTGELTGNAATATQLKTPRTIGGVSFNGTANINLPGVNIAGNQNTSGNAATASKLAAAVLIGGIAFDGSAAINLPGVNIAGNQNTSGNAATASKLAAARTISLTGDATGSLSFDGSANASAALTLANTGIAAGTYKSITVDAKGRATAGNDVVTGLVTSSAATGVTNVATSNTNTFLNITEKVGAATASAGTSTQITGAGTVTIASDSAGKITITGAQSITGNAATASKLAAARTISLTGDATGSLSFDGSANASAALTLANTGIAAGTYKSITVDAKGRATAGNDVVTGLVTAATAAGTANAATGNTNTFLNITEKVGAATASAGTSTQITGAGTVTIASDSAGKITITGAQSITGNAATASKLATARTISLTGNATGSTTFDGSGNVSINVNVGDDTHNHTNLATLATYSKVAADLPTAWPMGVSSTFVNVGVGYPSYGGVMNIKPYGNGGGTLQVYTPYGTGHGGDTLAVRFGNYNVDSGNSWTEFKYLIHDKNIDKYAPGKTGVGASGTWGIAITGNAATATKLATARTIGGVSFNGTANINLPGVNTAGNQNTSGNAATATKLQTARTISLTGDATGSLSFDGSANVSTALTLANSGVTAGTYRSVTVDAKGRTTAGDPVVIGLVTSSSATGVSNVATTNTNTFLNITEKVGTATASAGTSTQVVGAGTVTVSSDTAGKITITGAQSITGNAATATKLQTARSIALSGAVTGTATNFDGSANITIATTSIDGSKINTGTIPAARIPTLNQNTTGSAKVVLNQGTVAPLTGTASPERGLSMVQGYHNGYPHPYGNSLLLGGQGQGEIYVGWSGSNGGLAPSFIRNKRDTVDANWSAWREIVFKDEIGTLSAGTATKLATARTINGVSFDGSANITVADNTKLPLSGGTVTGTIDMNVENASFRFGRNFDIGFVKQAGTGGKMIVGNVHNFEIVKSTEASIPATISSTANQTFATLLSLTPTGVLTTPGGFNGNASTATKLATARTINGVAFDGTANITVADSTKLPTAGGTITGALTVSGLLTANGGFKGHYVTTDNRALKPSATPKGAFGAYFTSQGGLTGAANSVYGDLLALNSYNDASGGLANALFFAKGSKSIFHYQAAQGATTWGAASQLAYVTDNVASATKLATARTINGVAFDGTANITITDNTKLPLAGGTITGSLNVSDTITVTGVGDQVNAFKKLIQASTTTDGGYLAVGNNAADKGYVEIGTIDDADAEIYASQRNSANAVIRRAKLLDGAGNTSFPGTVTAPTFNGALNGNAATATKLQTARTIGGVSFDGTANINLPGVNTTGNQNTSGNAATATKLQTPRAINGVNFDGTAAIDLPLLGYGQSWQNLKASRALNTVYTNSTGKPIMVMVSIETSDDWGEPTVQVNDVQIARTLGYQSSGTGHWGMNISFIVPAGHTYQVISKVAGSYMEWAELR